MTATCIPYTQVPHSSALLIDYLYHYDRVSQFYNGSPYNPESYQKVAAQLRGFEGERHEIVEILARQNQAFGCGELTLANIKRLGDPETFAVVTGNRWGCFPDRPSLCTKLSRRSAWRRRFPSRDYHASRFSGWPQKTTTWLRSRKRPPSTMNMN